MNMATKNENDKVILGLKKQIADKKAALKATERFTPVTNCSIELDGVRSNIQVLTKEQLVFMMVRLNSYLLSAKDLGLVNDFSISGYSIESWLTDLKARLMNLNRQVEENRLKALEAKLHALLSNEKQIELEIDSIAQLLKE
jgi:hypothetical protein